MAIAPGLMQQKPRGLFGSSARVGPQPAMAAPEQQQKPGFDWRKLIGVLGDSLSIAGGGQPMFVPNMIDQRNRQQAQTYAEQQYQRRRQDEWTDWQRQEQWKRDNPAPVNNDTINDFNWYKGLSEEDKAIYRQMKPEYRQGPDGRFYRIDIAPDAGRPAIGAVVPDPRKQGGPSATPTGTFPR